MIAARVAQNAAAAGIMGAMDDLRAAFAVVGSLRESDAIGLRRATHEDTDAGLASRVADAMRGGAPTRVGAFWAASGHDVILTVASRAGITDEGASLLVGAAVNALVLAKSDVNETTVKDLAERAAAWDRGRTFGEATAGVTA